MNFNTFNWHDSVLQDIYIDRNQPGMKDSIKLKINFPEQGLYYIIFEDVYWANLYLNFGIVAEEAILNAQIEDENNDDLNNFYKKWKGLMNEVKLNLYKIEFNSSGSTIKIIAKNINPKLIG